VQISNPGQANKSKRIFQKKDLVDAVRKVQTVRGSPNPQHVDLIARDPSKTSILAEPEASKNPASREVDFLEEGVHQNARKYNDIKLVADKKQLELNKLLDIHKELSTENLALSKIKEGSTTDATKISRLEEEIAKVQQDMESKFFFKQQLEHMLRRLAVKQFS
jgi:hypothetical protein